MDKDKVVTILNGCGFHTLIGIEHLVDRCLITIDWYNKLTMHQLVRDMGREIVRQESDEQGERSRVWNHQEAFDVLTEKTGTKCIKGLNLDLQMLKKEACSSFCIQTKAFAKMHKLELLQLNYIRVEGSIENLPKTLVWLCWHYFPWEYMQNSSHIEKIVVLEMSYSNLCSLFQESLPLPRLKILNLSNSYDLSKTPDFKVLPNLERLVLENCIKLGKIDESIGVLEKLVLLNLNGCIKLRSLPRTIGNLKALQELYLAGCKELIRSFPREKMDKLKVLDEDGITTEVDEREVNKHSGLGLVSRGATKLNQFLPGNLRLPFLKTLDLRGNKFCTLPDDMFKGCPSLVDLYLSECRDLIAVPDVPDGLKYLGLEGCQSITKIPDMSNSDGFTFYDIEEEDIDMIHSLKLFHKHIMGNFQLQMQSSVADMRITSPVKALREHGIFSFFQSGSEIPSWYKYQEEGSSISFVLEDDIIYALNICIVYELIPDDCSEDGFAWPHLFVTYRGTRLFYSPVFVAVGVSGGGGEGPSEGCKDMLWLSCWNFYNVLYAGDEVEVSVREYSDSFEFKRIGVHPVVQREWDDSLPSLLPPPLSHNLTEDEEGYYFESTRFLTA